MLKERSEKILVKLKNIWEGISEGSGRIAQESSGGVRGRKRGSNMAASCAAPLMIQTLPLQSMVMCTDSQMCRVRGEDGGA